LIGVRFAFPLGQLAVELRRQHFQQFGVVGHEGQVKVAGSEKDRIPACFEFDPTTIGSLVNFLMIGVPPQLDPTASTKARPNPRELPVINQILLTIF
jgi:hypothetical protein